tara:strand:+ start:732 stop:1031 length:300 start_codon:yes stop_codon:yes gene_type:complete
MNDLRDKIRRLWVLGHPSIAPSWRTESDEDLAERYGWVAHAPVVVLEEIGTDGSRYAATCVADCRDTTDEMVYQLVLQFGQEILMGRTIGQPMGQGRLS